MPCDDLGSAWLADGTAGVGVEFFFVARGKILILLRLGWTDRPLFGQNIESKWVGRKILWNKGLAAQIGPGVRVASNWF
jgi:hypothetical protein